MQIHCAAQKVIRETRGPIASTEEIAAEIGASGETVRNRIDEIEGLESKKIGGDGPRIYWLSD